MQELGEKEYTADESSATQAFEDVAVEFGRFAQLRGRILDVGCGIAGLPAYARSPAPESIFVGLDPLAGDAERGFPVVRGIGERLPFRDGVFDTVVSATALDHVPDPEQVLGEMRRVLKPGASVALWVAVVDESLFRPEPGSSLPAVLADSEVRSHALRLLRERQLRRVFSGAWRLVVEAGRRPLLRTRRRLDPRGFIEEVFAERMRYHFNFFRVDELVALVSASGFHVEDRRLLEDPGRGNSIFLRARPAVAAD